MLGQDDAAGVQQDRQQPGRLLGLGLRERHAPAGQGDEDQYNGGGKPAVHLAMVMAGTSVLETSVTVIWNNW